MLFNRFLLSAVLGILFTSGCQQPHDTGSSQTLDRTIPTSLERSARHSIIGGTPVSNDDPLSLSTVALYMPNEKPTPGISNFCTGTLIAPRVVLTAAHCFLDMAQGYVRIPLEDFVQQVRIGFGLTVVKEESNEANVVFRKIQRLTVHPDYRAGMVRRALKVPMPDVAILLLDEEAPTGSIPAPLGFDETLIEKDRTITLAGFGVTEANLRSKPKQLMKTDVQIDNPRLTSAQFSYRVVNRKSACFADSGGPAYFTLPDGSFVVGGITSWGDPSCARMGVYTSVAAFQTFISEVLLDYSNN